MNYKQSKQYLIENGYNPDELVAKGVFIVRRIALIARIKQIVYKEVDPLDRIIEIKAVIQDFETKGDELSHSID